MVKDYVKLVKEKRLGFVIYPDGRMDAEYQVAEGDKALEQLAKLERKVVCMHILKDYSFARIAKIIGRPESSVKTIYYRTLKKLKHRLF